MVDGVTRVVALVPARGGSDRVPYLNLKRLGDKPLLAHTLEAARAARSVHRVVVSTDDERVAEVAREFGAEVPFLRPAELAADLPSLKPVIVHAVGALEAQGERCDVVVVLQATTPLRDAAAIDAAVARLLGSDLDAVISVTEDRTLNWREQDGRLVPLFAREGRREDQPALYRENGAVVALRRATLDQPTRFGERIGFVVLDKRAGFTVYDLHDFWMAERLLGQPRVLFRVDGGAEMGLGHVFRSLAIADALRENSRAETGFLMRSDPPEGLKVVASHGYPVFVLGDAGLENALGRVRDFAPDVIVNDLPRIEAAWLQALAHIGAATINLVDTPDDVERPEAYAQVVVSVMADERETPEGFYAGPSYAILREHFSGAPEKEIRERPRRVLLTFGGADPQGLTVKAARALDVLPEDVELLAVAGPAFPWKREFEALATGLRHRVPLISGAGGHIADLMQDADLVVCSGGMTVYELAALGTPAVVLGQNAREEQRMRAFARHGTLRFLGLGPDVADETLFAAVAALLHDAAARTEMSRNGRRLVDGMGASRAAEVVLHRARARDGQEGRTES